VDFNLDSSGPIRESVSILVGPNGSGKSSFLRDLAVRYCHDRNIVIVCNTPHDRFAGLRGTRRISVGKKEGSPKIIVKNAVAQSLAGSGAEFYQISSTLEYCGYRPRFGFRIEPGRLYGRTIDEIRLELQRPFDDELNLDIHKDDIENALGFLARHHESETIWIDVSEKVLEFSRSREFAAVLRLESKLRAWKVLRGMRVFLQRFDDDDAIEMRHASSGQLAMISSLLFLIASAGENPLVIIDEPENSLHPTWQREYVEKVLTALSYRGATVIVATHAPLVVTGALSDSPSIVSVFAVRNGVTQRLPIDSAASAQSSIEEILWRAFEVVTPANHFVSEQIVAEVSRFEKGETSKEDVLELIQRMEDKSFDERQRSFFAAVKTLLGKVEAARNENGQ